MSATVSVARLSTVFRFVLARSMPQGVPSALLQHARSNFQKAATRAPSTMTFQLPVKVTKRLTRRRVELEVSSLLFLVLLDVLPCWHSSQEECYTSESKASPLNTVPLNDIVYTLTTVALQSSDIYTVCSGMPRRTGSVE